jgi:Zn-dependent peptidase ImmA (M78 family)
MPVNVRSHPDYPFSNANLESSIAEIEKFKAKPPMSGAERGEILEFVRLTRQYAFLERLIQGDVHFDLPVHMENFAEERMPAEAQAEAMAREERELLDLGTEPGLALNEALDDRGIKLFRRCHGVDPSGDLHGAFFYAGDLGPALLACACAESVDAPFILAHEYGHLVMDVNPYENRFCRWSRRDLENRSGSSVEEARADRFARALLVPEDLLMGAWREIEPEKVAAILGVPPALVWRRLGDIGASRGEAPPPLPPMTIEHEIDEMPPTDLPERFVNLAIAAYASRFLEIGELSRFLRVAPKRIAQFIEWSRIPRDREREDSAIIGDDEDDGSN